MHTTKTHERSDWGYSKTFSSYDDANSIDRIELGYIVKLPDAVVRRALTEWCKSNCKSKWGWWFDADNGYIGFESLEEKMQFCLSTDYMN